jgi:hypothetical protein
MMAEDGLEAEEVKSIHPKAKTRHGKCVICSVNAEYCIRGVPEDCYCRECAEEFFQSLEDLDKF